MADPRFHRRQGPFALGALAELVNGTLTDPAFAQVMIIDIAATKDASEGCLVYCEDRRVLADLLLTKPTAVVMRSSEREALAGVPGIEVKSPALAFAQIGALFYPPQLTSGIHASACLDPTAGIGRDVEIGPGVRIGRGAEIGDRCRIDANAVVGDGCVLGPECWIGSNVSLDCAILGARVQVKPGARLGQSGFGFIPGPRGLLRMPQVGRLLIGDDVEIGANSCIDRGALGDTVIGAGTKIDNLVQIGHNTVVGKHCIIVAQVGISGSSRLEDGVVMGGQSAMAGHLTIGAGAKVAAQAGIMRDIEPGTVVGGSPAVPIRQFHKQTTWLAKQIMRKE